MSTWLPDYLSQVPTLKFLDPLGAFLTGKTNPEPVEYSFTEVIKQSGHACPTMAGAYGLVYQAMQALYAPGETPVRGQIKVTCPGAANEGSMGPLSQGITYLTGAAGENGFKGLAGDFVRSGLLHFNRGQDYFTFVRLDNQKEIKLRYRSDLIPGDPRMGQLLQKAIQEEATPEELAEFGRLWQARVAYVLIEEAHRKKLFEVV